MAHATLHFSAGLITGSLLAAPVVRSAWRTNRPLCLPILGLMLSAWIVGIWALVPSFCRHMGLPERFVGGWWMNIFLFHPIIAGFMRRSMFAGSVMMAAVLAYHYLLILLAIRRNRAA
jgi:hypothetical protein